MCGLLVFGLYAHRLVFLVVVQDRADDDVPLRALPLPLYPAAGDLGFRNDGGSHRGAVLRVTRIFWAAFALSCRFTGNRFRSRTTRPPLSSLKPRREMPFIF